MVVALDFDGTTVSHEYPDIGRDIGAESVLKRLINSGHRIILYTMRSGQYLDEATEWFNKRGIPLYGINTNPTQRSWTTSPKCYAQLYIDDAALGCPLIYPENAREYADWKKIEEMLIEKGIIV